MRASRTRNCELTCEKHGGKGCKQVTEYLSSISMKQVVDSSPTRPRNARSLVADLHTQGRAELKTNAVPRQVSQLPGFPDHGAGLPLQETEPSVLEARTGTLTA